jgi:DNA-binding beta-propeller fold protein YncE
VKRILSCTLALALPLVANGNEEGARFAARYEASLYSSGRDPGFYAPQGVSVDPFGNVFVADTGNHRVVQFDSQGRYVIELGGYGWDDGELSRPTDVAAGEGFRLFVVDAGNERIQEFDIGDSSPEGVVFPFREGSGLGDEALVHPERMRVDGEGRIYVSDSRCHCVWIFTPTGELVVRLGGLGKEATRFRDPAGVAVDGRGHVFVADSGNARIQVFDPIGNWVASWSGGSEDPFVEPIGIDVGPDGNVYVADAGAHCVRMLTRDGIPLLRFGTEGDGAGSFRRPVDVALGPDGALYVVDEVRQVVERFRVVRMADGE